MGARWVVEGADGADPARTVTYDFDQARVVLGRASWADVRLPDLSVSPHHATLRVQGSGYVLIDEGSTNGTWVGDTRLPPGRPRVLESGDVVRIGRFTLRFAGGVPVAEATTIDRTSAYARMLLREALGATERVAPPELRVVEGPDTGQRFELPPPPARLVLGRGSECAFTLRDAECSREAVELTADAEGTLAKDIGSKNPLLVNGREVTSRRLRTGDELTVGASRLVYEDPAELGLRALDGKSDLAAPPPPLPAPEPLPNGHPPDDASGPVPGTAPAEARARGAELFIYVLAGSVLILSIAGLLMLLRAG